MVTIGDNIFVVFGREQILQSNHTQILFSCWIDVLLFPFKVYIPVVKNLKTGTIHLKVDFMSR